MPNFIYRPLTALKHDDFHALALKLELEAAIPFEVIGLVKDLGAEPPNFRVTCSGDLTGHETVMDAVFAAHENQEPPDPDEALPMKFRRVGELYDITPQGANADPVMSIFDFPIIDELEIEGGAYALIGEGHVERDNITFDVIDKDGVLEAIHGAPSGVVVTLHRMVDHEFVSPTVKNEIPVTTPGRVAIIAGLYLRTKYESHNTDPNATPKLGVKFQVYDK